MPLADEVGERGSGRVRSRDSSQAVTNSESAFNRPDILESVIFALKITLGRNPGLLRQLRTFTLTADVKKRRRIWKRLFSEKAGYDNWDSPTISVKPTDYYECIRVNR